MNKFEKVKGKLTTLLAIALFIFSFAVGVFCVWAAFNICVPTTPKINTVTVKSIVIYTQDGCSACERAKDELRSKGLVFTERNLTNNPANVALATKDLGHKPTKTPEIFVNGKHVNDINEVK